ncbi:hypothetical protein L1987_88822 [Smallanthus sonchifolius]|nr:hypothetical protein L1987_88822 [Smallanthus sonchifolius]
MFLAPRLAYLSSETVQEVFLNKKRESEYTPSGTIPYQSSYFVLLEVKIPIDLRAGQALEIVGMASPELREMQEQWRDEEDERSSSAREMPGPSNAGPSNPAPISIPVSAISQDLIWGNLVQNNFSLENIPPVSTLREKAPYNPEECLIDFLNEKEELTPEWDPVKKDERNLALLKDLIKDSFPETTKTDSETAVERGLLLLIYGVLLSLAKPYIPLSEGSCSRKKKASLPNQSDQSPGKNVASPDLKMLLGEGGKRAKRGSEGGKMDEVEVTLAPKTSWKKNLPIFFLDESRGT